jgi:trimethylamine:corrinoid methyltransferase-like protein
VRVKGIPGGLCAPLDEAQVRPIHGAATEVLKTVRVDVPVPHTLCLFRARGNGVCGSGVERAALTHARSWSRQT